MFTNCHLFGAGQVAYTGCVEISFVENSCLLLLDNNADESGES